MNRLSCNGGNCHPENRASIAVCASANVATLPLVTHWFGFSISIMSFSGNLRVEKSHFKQTAKESQDCTCDDFVPTTHLRNYRRLMLWPPHQTTHAEGTITFDNIPHPWRCQREHPGDRKMWQVPEPYECRKFQKLEVEVLAQDAAHSSLVTENKRTASIVGHMNHVSAKLLHALQWLLVAQLCCNLLRQWKTVLRRALDHLGRVKWWQLLRICRVKVG